MSLLYYSPCVTHCESCTVIWILLQFPSYLTVQLIQSSQQCLWKNSHIDYSIIKALVDLEFCQLLFKIKSLRDLILKDRRLSKKTLDGVLG
mmetsp:Transcript_10656/g.39778  ORF Transcript_10656/g.39778 Transcript_10656/m.39778 type:complete len:91 (+) Transcript_10656:1813-2085(+)